MDARRARPITGGRASLPHLRDIYTGAAQNFNLASGYTYPAVAVPKQLAGVPSLGDDLRDLRTYLLDEGPVIVQTMLVMGTAWRWARWSDKLKRLVWEAIPDECIGSQGIETDLDTGEIKTIRTHESIEFNGPDFKTLRAERKRVISREEISEEWSGDIRKFTRARNPFGFMPIPFGHDCWESDWRGNGIYSRIIRLMADTHEIRRNRDETLAQFKPKMVQSSADIGQWIKNNKQYTASGESDYYSPFAADLVLNRVSEGGSQETTSYLFLPSDATTQHTAAIEDNRREMMIASGVPEIFWGQIATGNAASTDSQITAGVNYIKGIQREMTRAYGKLLNQSAQILAHMRFGRADAIEVKWGTLDMTSPEQRGRVLQGYAAAMSQMLGNGSVSAEGALYFTRLMFEDYPAEDAAQYLDAINVMLAEHSSKVGAGAMDMTGFGGGDML
ncbi:MAG: hypothetical protein LBD82_05940 [Deltaproteobacteria bacterium]|jgi:hypothetical protein|nr:hypothetical protein [Deltaproteobacteria bacterium]